MVSGRNTWQSIPASWQYAAADIPAFPADAKQKFSTFCSYAIEIAKDIPLSLKDPVGFTVSFFTKTVSAIGKSGVKPSPSDILFLTFGKTDSYLHSVSSSMLTLKCSLFCSQIYLTDNGFPHLHNHTGFSIVSNRDLHEVQT